MQEEFDEEINDEELNVAEGGEVTYQSLLTEEPELDLEEEFGVEPTVTEAQKTGEFKSDIQAIVSRLCPEYQDVRLNELLQSAGPARTYPDNIIEKNFLIVMSHIEMNQDDPDLDPAKIISLVQDGISRGDSGKERVELLELAGVVHEEEMEKIAKDMGL